MLFLGKHLLVQLASEANGTREAFGVVTRVWHQPDLARRGLVNLVVYPDGVGPVVMTSVVVFDSPAEAFEAQRRDGGVVAYLPPVPART